MPLCFPMGSSSQRTGQKPLQVPHSSCFPRNLPCACPPRTFVSSKLLFQKDFRTQSWISSFPVKLSKSCTLFVICLQRLLNADRWGFAVQEAAHPWWEYVPLLHVMGWENLSLHPKNPFCEIQGARAGGAPSWHLLGIAPSQCGPRFFSKGGC